MSVIGYLSVVLAVLTMLACGRVLRGVAAVALHPGGVRMYLPHAVWTAVALWWPIRFLWGAWQLGAVVILPRFFRFPMFALLVGAGLMLVLMAEAVVPRRPDDAGPVDLRAHYFRAHRLFFLAALVFWLATWAMNVYVLRPPLLAATNFVAAGSAALLLAGVLCRSPRFHGVLALLAVAFTLFELFRLAVG